MNFKIKQQNQEPNQDIELFLKKIKDKIWLDGKDSKGTIRSLMVFEEGKFRRIQDAKLQGLETDGEGRIIEMEE